MQKRLTAEQAQSLLSELSAFLAKKYSLKKVTSRYIASYMRCSPQAVCLWKQRGISPIRAKNLYLEFPFLKIWSKVKF